MEKNEIDTTQIESEWALAFCALCSPIYIVEEFGYLPGSIFLNRELGQFWDNCKKYKDSMRAAHEVSPTFFAEISVKSNNYLVLTNRADEYVRLIWKMTYARTALDYAGKIATAALELDTDKAFRVVSELAKILPENDTKKEGDDSAIDLAEDFNENLGKNTAGIATGFPIWDKKIGTLDKGTLTFIAGRPNIGKTGLCLQLARNLVMHNVKIIYFSTEMSKERLWKRMVAPYAGVSIIELRGDELTIEKEERIKRKSSELGATLGIDFVVKDNSYKPDKMYRDCIVNRPQVILIDHVDEMKRPSGAKENLWRSEYMKEVRDFSKDLDIAVVALLQLNRDIESRDKKIPVLSDLRWDGGLEQVADVILMCHREDMYSDVPVTAKVIPFEIWVRKNRDEASNYLIPMFYDMEKQWFSDDTKSYMTSKISF